MKEFVISSKLLAIPAAFAIFSIVKPYEELVDFIASLSPRELVEFKPSDTARQRVWDLIEQKKSTGLPPDETAELDHYLEIEHLMRLAKTRARELLAHGQ